MVIVVDIEAWTGDIVSDVKQAALIVGISRNTLADKLTEQGKCFVGHYFIQKDITISKSERGRKCQSEIHT
jgi:predicted DNA-binding protein (UPF0251 family)